MNEQPRKDRAGAMLAHPICRAYERARKIDPSIHPKEIWPVCWLAMFEIEGMRDQEPDPNTAAQWVRYYSRDPERALKVLQAVRPLYRPPEISIEILIRTSASDEAALDAIEAACPDELARVVNADGPLAFLKGKRKTYNRQDAAALRKFPELKYLLFIEVGLRPDAFSNYAKITRAFGKHISRSLSDWIDGR